MSTATARTVFVLGNAIEGNRDIVVVESGETYTLDADAIKVYTVQDARIPYTLPA